MSFVILVQVRKLSNEVHKSDITNISRFKDHSKVYNNYSYLTFLESARLVFLFQPAIYELYTVREYYSPFLHINFLQFCHISNAVDTIVLVQSILLNNIVNIVENITNFSNSTLFGS